MKRYFISFLQKFAYVRLLERRCNRVIDDNNELRRYSNSQYGMRHNFEQENKKLRNDIKVVSGVLDKANEQLAGQYIANDALKKDNGTLLRRISEQSEVITSLYKRLEVAEKNDNWIPVSERLPKYDGEYQCTCRTKNGFKRVEPDVLLVTTMVYVKQKWKNVWFQTVPFYDVIAWQPLPEPYQP